jgi:hypothetical protein
MSNFISATTRASKPQDANSLEKILLELMSCDRNTQLALLAVCRLQRTEHPYRHYVWFQREDSSLQCQRNCLGMADHRRHWDRVTPLAGIGADLRTSATASSSSARFRFSSPTSSAVVVVVVVIIIGSGRRRTYLIRPQAESLVLDLGQDEFPPVVAIVGFQAFARATDNASTSHSTPQTCVAVY